MKLKLLSLVTLAALLSVGAAAQQSTPVWYKAADFNYAIQSQAANTYTFYPQMICKQSAAGLSFTPFATNAPIYIADAVAANSETVTPSVVIATSAACGVTISPGNSHYSFQMISGTGGLQEAINAVTGSAAHPAGIVLDRAWYNAAAAVGTPSTIISSAVGSTSKYLVDVTAAPWVFYTWNGSAYVANSGSGASQMATANGASVAYGSASELLTLATGATTTDTTANLLPANSIIDSVVGRVTTTITAACTGWELGDASTAARFTANDTTLTAGESQVGLAQWSGTIRAVQTNAAKVRVTCAGGNPGAGAIRITVFYHTFGAPTS